MINDVGNPMETTIALSHLVLGGVIERHPRAKIVAVHGGGYLPFYADRMDHAREARADVGPSINRLPSSYLKQITFDTLVFGEGLGRLVQLVGAEHVVLGTDYPFEMGDDHPAGRISGVASLSAGDRSLICGLNSARLLGIAADGDATA
jgi:aminocarboxymuconate-semialdehyde decarboxylase